MIEFDSIKYIAQSEKTRKSSLYKEDSLLVNLFKHIVSRDFDTQNRIEFLETYSKKIFPRTITINNKENYLLWDTHFWSYFEKFVSILLGLQKNINKEPLKNCFYHNIYKFLSYVMEVDDPIKSFALAKFSQKFSITNFEEEAYTKRELKDFRNINFYSKLFVFCHERTHLYYKFKPPLKRKQDIQTLRKLIIQYIFLLENVEEFSFSFRNNTEKQKYFSYLGYLYDLKDMDLIEEVLCDFFAYRESILYWKQILPNQDVEDTLMALQTSGRMCSTIQGFLKYIMFDWKYPYDNSNYSIEKYKENLNLLHSDGTIRNEIVSNLFAVDCFNRLGVSGICKDYLSGPYIDDVNYLICDCIFANSKTEIDSIMDDIAKMKFSKKQMLDEKDLITGWNDT